MSLHWDVTKVKNYKTKCWEATPEGNSRPHPTTDRLVWACLEVDLNGITAKNADEFYARYVMYSRATERDPDETWLTYTDVQSHIGLRTNVRSTTKLQFTKRIGQITRERAEGVTRRAKQRANQDIH